MLSVFLGRYLGVEKLVSSCISVIVSVTIHTGEDPQVLLYTLTRKIVRANGVKQERHREVDCFDLVTQP